MGVERERVPARHLLFLFMVCHIIEVIQERGPHKAGGWGEGRYEVRGQKRIG